jgi:hypothetical protein
MDSKKTGLEGEASRSQPKRNDIESVYPATSKNKLLAIVQEGYIKLYAENNLTPSRRCLCCKRVITDPTSFQRGVGSECWQEVLRVFETLSSDKPPVEV